jgi:hypothetical protein
MLFNKSLHQNIFPTDWKLANVIPLFKAGDTSFPSNNRSVSLLSCVSKLKTKVFRHIFNHVKENKLLCKFQSDFLPSCSTTHQLVELYYRILLALDSKQFTSVTFADISKAFDTVDKRAFTQIGKIWYRGQFAYLVKKLLIKPPTKSCDKRYPIKHWSA